MHALLVISRSDFKNVFPPRTSKEPSLLLVFLGSAFFISEDVTVDFFFVLILEEEEGGTPEISEVAGLIDVDITLITLLMKPTTLLPSLGVVEEETVRAFLASSFSVEGDGFGRFGMIDGDG